MSDTLRLRFYDVFVPGGFPRHTYNPRATLQLEDRLVEVRRNLCKLVTVTGHTKSGKTVLTRKVIPPGESIWIDGGMIGTEDDFWEIIVNALDLYQESAEETKSETSSTTGTKVSGGFSIFGTGATGEAGAEAGRAKGEGKTYSRSLSARVVALQGLREDQRPIVIDDFHYLDRELQGDIVRALKPLIFDGLPVVIIAIPHRRYDAMKVEREMTGRIQGIDIPAWDRTELEYIPATGFGLLNYGLPPGVASQLAEQAIGSPHLMQDFCRGLCKLLGVNEARDELEQLRISDTDLKVVYEDVAATIGRPIFEKLARGPRQRTDRLQRELKGGETVDIYELVLRALAHLRPGLVSLEYEDLRTAIKAVSASEIPQLHEVARVLKHMATIASGDQSSTPVIDFEEDEKKLHITDPFFAFFLRWGDLHV
ncbi:MAG TPA: hypothetical protein VGQ29_06275 [Gemmatimonadales bacterium]|jgi:hypothetical protein|nr:hypothetical protein [Gemmatimonadales bacterium]